MTPYPLALAKEALESFVRHGRACGAFGDDPGPFWIMTDEGHRDVPADDFRRAREALAALDAGGWEDALTQRLIAALRHGGLGKVTVDAEQPGDAELRGYFDLEKAARYLTLPPPPQGERPVEFHDHTGCPGCRICDKGHYG